MNRKNLLFLIPFLAFSTSCSLKKKTNGGEDKKQQTADNVESITLNNDSLIIGVGETVQLIATTSPANVTVTWQSTNPAVATVENGLVRGVSDGNAVIIAKAGDKITACAFVVENSEPIVGPIDNFVSEVSVSYNGKKVTNGLIEVDISSGSCAITGSVKVVGNPQYTLTYAIDDPNVATIDNQGNITLKKAGEAVITVSAGDAYFQVVLVVTDNFKQTVQYTITVNGGTASVVTAEEGDHVFLTADIESIEAQHNDFAGWVYYNADTGEEVTDDLWLNGSVFAMPDFNIRVEAVVEAKLYTLNVVDGIIKTCVVDGGNINPIYTTEGTTNIYKLPYNAEVTIKANEEPEGYAFVGFDVGSRKNRKGELGVTEYTFTMPDETYSVFARFSESRKIPFGSYTAFGTSTKKAITNGKVEGETSADADLKGYSGYSFTFKSTTGATESPSYPDGGFTNCGDFSTLKHGSQTIRTIYKNHSNQSFKVEMYAEQYSTYAVSGEVTIPANSVVMSEFIASAGFHNPSFGLVLRQAATGGTDTDIQLDVAMASSDTYPDGDPQFVVPEAQYVVLKKLTNGADFPANSGIRGDCFQCGPNAAATAGAPTSGSFGGRKNTNNENGITNFILRDSYMTYSSDSTKYPYIYGEASNQPLFSDGAEVTVYFRVNNTSNNTGKFIFGVGNSTDVLKDSTRVTADITLQPKTSYIFGISYTRAAAQDPLYISIVRPDKGETKDFNIIMQLMYNNKIGCLDENIYKKAA